MELIRKLWKKFHFSPQRKVLLSWALPSYVTLLTTQTSFTQAGHLSPLARNVKHKTGPFRQSSPAPSY